jgi:hypothetical protein
MPIRIKKSLNKMHSRFTRCHGMEGSGYKLPKKNIDIVANSTFQCWIIILFRNFHLEKNKLLIQSVSEFVKLVKIAMCQVLGSIEDERCFNTLSFMMSKFCNRLVSHMFVCEDVFIRFLQHWVSPLYSCHIYLEGEKYSLQCSFLKLEGLLAAWRLLVFCGFWCSIIGFYFRL